MHAAGIVHRTSSRPTCCSSPPAAPARTCGSPTSASPRPATPSGVRWTGLAGTDGYLAPERLRGAPAHARQDVYAAGVVAVELLTGRRPRPGNGAPPGPLRPLLESMTEPDPARRTASVGAALGHLRRLGVPDLLGEPVVPVPDRLGDPPARRRRRWPLVG